MATIQLSSSLQALVPPHGLYGAQEKKENNGATHQVGKKKKEGGSGCCAGRVHSRSDRKKVERGSGLNEKESNVSYDLSVLSAIHSMRRVVVPHFLQNEQKNPLHLP